MEDPNKLMSDAYFARITREKVEYMEELSNSIFDVLGTKDEEIWADGRVTFSEEKKDIGITDYTVKFEGNKTGVIRGEVFENGGFRFSKLA